MRYLVILLALTLSVGSLSFAYGSVSLDRTAYPIPDIEPLKLWNMNDVIIDGTVVDRESIQDENGKEVFGYNIKVNEYFKGKQNAKIIHAKQLHAFPNFNLEKDDNALFYIRSTSEFGYVIQSHSVKTFANCDARSMIEIIPVLPNEERPRSAPTRSESYFDPCVADYFTYDPDFFSGIHNGISPLEQVKHGIPNEMIRCYDGLVLLQKYDGTPACIKPESVDKLKQRGFSYVPLGASFHVEKDCNNVDGRAEAQCFKEAFDTCTFAKANSVIHTIEGDAMYLESIIKADCNIHTTFDNMGDRFWGPTAGITKDVCNNVELEEDHVWIINECTSEPEFQINYMGQDWELEKKCRDISGTWNSTHHNCVDMPDLEACEDSGGSLTCMSYEQMGHGRDVCRNVCTFDADDVDRK